ncbi:RNA chaperone ProQ [Algibacillus agarilyticus]|uniref:RNA chaperone ProQ n=1 Tax=Algibacillus agarilyticus TaxID=2234133 RepID=UPI000DD0683C|nr:RNA chaperone ProQ [Algibacillus agarilyticus]
MQENEQVKNVEETVVTEAVAEAEVVNTENVNEVAETTETTVEETVEKIKETNAVIAYLAEQFPNCFSVKGNAKPIKIGIFKDLAEEVDKEGKVSRTILRTALRKYTSSWRYLDSIKEGAMRVDIQGNEVEAIEAEHVEHAKTTLTESKKKAAEKRKQNAPKRDKRPQNAANKDRKPKPAAKRAPKAKNVEVNVKKQHTVDTGLFVGKDVFVSMGRAPIGATVKEINNDEVVVVTATGFTIKTEKSNIVK